MAGEPEAIAPTPEVETPIAAEEPVNDNLVDDNLTEDAVTGDDGAVAPPPEPEEEFEEFEWNGKPLKAPKGLKDGVLMHADYTRKTQEVSREKEEVKAERQRMADQAKASEDDFNLRVQQHTLTQELEQYRNVDWNAWWSTDPVEAGKGQARVQQLQWEMQNVAQQVNTRATQRTQEAQQDFAKRLEQTREFARTKIKGWTPDLDQKIGEFARAQGIEDSALQAAMNPQVYSILHLAYLGHQALNKPVVPKLGPQPVPLTVVASKANPPARKDPADMSMDEYAAWRARGGGTKRG